MEPLFQRVVALYCRISYDKHGRAEGVEAQERWGRAYAARHWPNLPVEVFVDNDITAADVNVTRPAFERLRQWVRDGRVAHLWGVEQYRIVRQALEWFAFADELDAAGIHEVHTDRDGVILVHDDVAGIKAVLGAGEVRRLKRRLKDKYADEAARGLPPTCRTFGYRLVREKRGKRRYEQIPAEAEAIRWAAEAVLSGWSLESCAAEWRKRGLVGAHRVKVRDPETGEVQLDDDGEPVMQTTVVTGRTVRRALTNPTVAGMRVYDGEIVAEGVWEAIIPEETRQRILARLGSTREVRTAGGGLHPVDPATVSRKGRTRRRYLLTGGVAVCDVCEAPLAATMRKFRTGSGPYYRCDKGLGGKGCVGIAAEQFEKYVMRRLAAELRKPAFVERFAQDPSVEERAAITDQLGTMAGKRADLAAAWSSDGLTMEEWQQARAGLDQREQALRARLAEIPPPPADFDPRVLSDERVIDAMDLGERREWIDMFIKAVRVRKAKPPYQTIDFDARVAIDWK